MLKSRSFVATPAYRGEVVMQYAHCLVRDSIIALGQGHLVDPPFCINDTLVHYARNRALWAFLQGECDQLLFIDADMGWEQGALIRLIEMPGDIVGGIARTKRDEENYPFSTFPEGISDLVAPVAAVPTEFMKITRACAERMAAAYERPFEFDGDLGEDITFCNRARAQGFEIIAITDILFEHIGPNVWSGRCSDFLFPETELAA